MDHTVTALVDKSYKFAMQHSLKSKISCCGMGLHSGTNVSITLVPAPENTGIVFRQINNNKKSSDIVAHVDNVVDDRLCTTLGNSAGNTIATVEHLMAALRGCGIDNLYIEVEGSELPIMDGSSAPFVFLIECAGIVEQNAPRKAIQILKPISVENEGRLVELTPGPGFSVNFEIEFGSSAIGQQCMYIDLVNGTFKGELSRARTFGFIEEVDQLRSMGLALGGSLDNAVVVNGDEVLNEGGLRYKDEFVRHKILDCIGDLYLVGAPIIGHFKGYRSGHALNHAILRALLSDQDSWHYTTTMLEENNMDEEHEELPSLAIA